MKKISKLTGIIGLLMTVTSYGTIFSSNTVKITANETIAKQPTDTKAYFGLTFPWWFMKDHSIPTFTISSSPSTQSLITTDATGNIFNIPALLITFIKGRNSGLTWYYYCEGLMLNYTHENPAATITFSGDLTPQPGGNVTCHCDGNACSTHDVKAIFMQ